MRDRHDTPSPTPHAAGGRERADGDQALQRLGGTGMATRRSPDVDARDSGERGRQRTPTLDLDLLTR